MRSALPAVIIACAATLLLGGCVPQEPVVVPPVEQQSEPVFASDEEALAAATDALRKYQEMSNLVAQDGGANADRIASFVTEHWLEQELVGFNELQRDNRRQVGNVELKGSKLQAHMPDEVIVYFCVDFSHSRVVTQDNVDVTPDSRPSELTVEVRFLASESKVLLIDGMEPWPDSGIC